VQVGNALQQRQDWKRPEDLKEKQFIGKIPLELSPSDLAGQIVAALVSGALAMQKHGKIDGETTFKFVRFQFCGSTHSMQCCTLLVVLFKLR
jgi:hypothetical protein